jgi:hypothetical protein
MQQAETRRPGASIDLPKIGPKLEQLAQANNFNLLEKANRLELGSLLDDIKTKAPVARMSFASEPSPDFLATIVTWFRDNINPHTLMQVGLQPSIVIGCILKTPNKTFDFSLRQRFREQRALLSEKLHQPTSI